MFEDELQKCISCDKQWFLPHTLDSWYSRFREYLANGNCFYARDGIDPFKKTLEPEIFKMCLLWAARNNYFGSEYYKDVYFDQDGNITKYFFSIKTRDLEDPGSVSEQFLEDIRHIEDHFSLVRETFSHSLWFYDFEIYAVLQEEIFNVIAYAFLAVVLVVLLITFNIRITVFVVFVVSLVLVYMAAVCHYWGLTMNHIFAVNLSFALGISIDFSVHIAHKYLTTIPPNKLKTN